MDSKQQNMLQEFDHEHQKFNYQWQHYTIGDLLELINLGKLRAPISANTWSQERQSNFIESIILDYPIQSVTFYQNNNGKYTILDGNEQINAICLFMNNELYLSHLNVLKSFNHATYQDLPLKLQNSINVRLIPIIMLKNTTPTIRHEVIMRLNRKSN